MYQLSAFSITSFLSENWQRQPCVLTNVLPDFDDPLDEHDLAGLAQEEDIDSRIISHLNDAWTVTEGPFTEFDDLCQGAWTLMVQGVDAHIEEASLLMNAFNFIPHWRMDDLLVSFSQPGAGVGAHIDQYDVFIVQGKGQRRWQVGAKPKHSSRFYPHPKLQQTDEFEPIIDVVLHSGDVLYIPPGFPHKGESLSECLNYSIGFRAPDQSELLQVIADDLLENDKVTQRFSDTDREASEQPAALPARDMMLLKELLQQYVTSPQIDQVLTEYLSKQNETLDNYELDTPILRDEILELMTRGITIQHACGVRPVYLDRQTDHHTNNQTGHQSEAPFIFFINGQQFASTADEKALTSRILNHSQTLLQYSTEMSDAWIDMLCELINRGYIEIVGE